MPKFTKATRQAMRGKERKGPFEADINLNRIIPVGGGTNCYFRSFTDGTTQFYRIDSDEFAQMVTALDLRQQRAIRGEVCLLADKYPASYWPYVLEAVLGGI